MNRDLKELTNEELLKALEDSEDQLVVLDQGDFTKFVKEFDLVPGEVKIDKSILYNIYKAWSKEPLKFREFNSKLNFLTSENCYLIDENLFKIKKENWLFFTESKKTKQSTAISVKRHFDNFLKKTNISQGTIPNSFNKMFICYEQYQKQIKKINQHLRKTKFKELLDIYFKKIITKKGTYYLLNRDIDEKAKEEKNTKEE